MDGDDDILEELNHHVNANIQKRPDSLKTKNHHNSSDTRLTSYFEDPRTVAFFKKTDNAISIWRAQPSDGQNQHAVYQPAKVSQPNRVCGFCKKNNEPAQFYTSHCLKDDLGKTICPVLRSYMCETCGCSGDNAHTKNYCPLNKGQRSIATMPTNRMSSGKLRKK